MLFERGNFQDIENTNNNAKFLLPVMSVLQNMKKKKKKKKNLKNCLVFLVLPRIISIKKKKLLAGKTQQIIFK